MINELEKVRQTRWMLASRACPIPAIKIVGNLENEVFLSAAWVERR